LCLGNLHGTKSIKMCEDCFDSEITSFHTEKGWLEFDLNLSKKLGSNQMKHIEIKTDGINIYECNTCSQLWKLWDPDYSDRGYFLKTK
jgi:hypothetical protein